MTESSIHEPGERDYGVDVEKVIDGNVGRFETVRIALRPEQGRPGSSCGVVGRLQLNGRYRIEAYGGDLEGKRLLFANSCGGSVHLLAASSDESSSITSSSASPSTKSSPNGLPVAAPPGDKSDPNRWPFLIGAVVAVAAGATVVLQRRGRSS